MKYDRRKILTAIQSVLPTKQETVPLHEPLFQGNEWTYVKECIDTTWVSSVGKFVDQFEENLAKYIGVNRAVVTVNGTAALHIALVLAGVEKNDEVLLPTLTFVATANAVSYLGAIPHFVDSEERTLGIDPYKLEEYLAGSTLIRNGECFNKSSGRRIKAVVPMHTFGHPVDIDPLVKICKAYHIELVEDAAESMGSFYKGQHTGSFGTVAAVSFNGNKIITTGGGGAILTNDHSLAEKAKHLTTTAKIPHQWEYEHNQVAYNYRLPNINAALGCAQLEQLSSMLDNKRLLFTRYRDAFSELPGVQLYQEPQFAKSNYWLNVLILDKEYTDERDHLLTLLNENGVMARPVWKPMHQLEMYRDCPRMNVSCAESLARRIINIPSGAKLGGL